MVYDYGSDNISYFEYKAINELMHSHSAEFGRDLRTIVVFGPLLTGQETFDIDLLEVVDNWQGPQTMTFDSTPSLPLRGTLRLHFLSSAAFENLMSQKDQSLLNLLRDGYHVVYEVPAGYARSILVRSLTNNNYLNYLIKDDLFSTDERSSDPRKPLRGC